MKKLFYSLVFLLMSGFIFMACSNEDEIVMQEESSLSSKALTRSASMRRSLTSQEAAELKAIFPNLNTKNVIVTGEATRTYNCIAYSMG